MPEWLRWAFFIAWIILVLILVGILAYETTREK